ncbi:twin-arginine translocase TatA/TatE family subunit [Aeromonas caviae]|nr:twin-arginine translocase TatA/TatE family subunit [Aeromonas caviae]
MRLGGSPIWHRLTLLAVVVGVFGSKRLAGAARTCTAIRDFRHVWRGDGNIRNK